MAPSVLQKQLRSQKHEIDTFGNRVLTFADICIPSLVFSLSTIVAPVRHHHRVELASSGASSSATPGFLQIASIFGLSTDRCCQQTITSAVTKKYIEKSTHPAKALAESTRFHLCNSQQLRLMGALKGHYGLASLQILTTLDPLLQELLLLLEQPKTSAKQHNEFKYGHESFKNDTQFNGNSVLARSTPQLRHVWAFPFCQTVSRAQLGTLKN